MEEEDAIMQEEDDLAGDEADEVRPMKPIPTTGKTVEIHEECSTEWGVIMLVQADKTILWSLSAGNSLCPNL